MIIKRIKAFSDIPEERQYTNLKTAFAAAKRHAGRFVMENKAAYKVMKGGVLSPGEVQHLAAYNRLGGMKQGAIGAYKLAPKKVQQQVASAANAARPKYDYLVESGKGAVSSGSGYLTPVV